MNTPVSSASICPDSRAIRKRILNIALPCAFEQVLLMVVGVVSTVFVGRLSSEALSAVGLVNTMVNFILVLFTALSTGSTVLVARLIGENDLFAAKSASKQSLMAGISAAVFITAAIYATSDFLLNLFFKSAEPEVLEMALIYFRIILYSFPLLLANVIVGGILRGAGDTKTPMYVAYIVNIINVALSFILIFGVDLRFLTVEAMGIKGAAIAVTCARAFGGILILFTLLRPKGIINVDIKEKLSYDMRVIKRITKIGFPAAIEQIIVQGGLLILQVVISGMGTNAIAVYQIGMSVYSISWMPVWGFAIAATTLVGQSMGAKNPDLAEKYGWSILKMGMVIILSLGLFTFVFSETLVRIYSSDPEVISFGARSIKIFALSMPFLCVSQIFASALRGAGDLIYTMITSFVGIWGFRLLLTVLVNRLFSLGINSVWVAICFDFAIRAVMYMIRFKKGMWKKIVI